jgi:hypothetical protein
MQSEAIGELAAALSKAQKAFKPLTKGRTAKAGSYEYDYADLADLIAATTGPLADNGLAVAQTFRYVDGHMVLVTKLMHTGGQFLDSEYPIGNYGKPQETGSAITYGRRYSWQAMVGIAPVGEDDDGQKAQQAEVPARREERRDEPERPLEGDDAAIVFVAAELAQVRGALDPADVIEEYSKFKGRDGKTQSFRDPTKVRSEKWKKGVRQRMEADLAKQQAIREPGVDEAVDLFDGAVIQR